MTAQQPNPGNQILTLAPLLDDGPDALDTHDIPPLTGATLSEIEVQWNNVEFGITVRRAEDLFALHVPGHPLVPPSGTITKATFKIRFQDSTVPHKVTICPPSQLTLECPSDAPRVHPWLDKRRFRIQKQILRTTAALLLALASAISPALDDDDGDDDDISSDRRAFCA